MKKEVFFALFAACAVAACGYGAPPANPGVMLGAFIPPTNDYTGTILAFDQNTDFTHTHILMFCSFDYSFEKWPYLLDQMKASGKIPVIVWQPGVEGRPDPSFSYASFLNGNHDAQIDRMARELMNYGDPVYLRFAHEMNIRSAPMWPGHSWNHNDPQGFIDMYRYVRERFDQVGADNVIWVWSVNYEGDAIGHDTFSNWKNLYPGDAYVDMVGLSGLNYGDHPTAGPGFSVTVQWLYMPILRDMMAGDYVGGAKSAARALRELASTTGGKPQGIFEFGTVGGRDDRSLHTYSDLPKEDWILQGYESIRTMEEFAYVRLVLWYNGIATSGGYLSDFRVTQNPGVPGEYPVPPGWTEAYKQAIRGGGGTFFLEEPLTLEEMTPDGYYRAPSLITPAGYPQHEFWLSVPPGAEAKRGSNLAATYFLYPPINPGPENWGCDAYVAAKIPGGEWYAFVPPAKWVSFNPASGIPPAAKAGLDVKRESRGTAFVVPLSYTLPGGLYTIYSILVPPGSDPRGLGADLKTTTFTLAD